MSITAGQTALASDFINESEADATPANNSGKVSKLESDGKISDFFLRNALSVTAGEDISAGEYCFISDGTQNGVISNTSTNFDNKIDAATEYWAQTFTMTTAFKKIGKVSFKLRKSGSPTGTLTVGLKATSSGLPTGANLASDTINVSTFTTSYVFYTFDMDVSGLTVGAQYAITLDPSALTLNASNYIEVPYHSTSTTYTGGTRCDSSDGTSWSDQGGDLVFAVECLSTVGEAYLYDTSYGKIQKGGIALTTETSGSSINIQERGIYTTSGLTVGKQYVQSTAGAIGTTQSGVCIGNAISTTQLILYPDLKGSFSPVIDFGTNINQLIKYNGTLLIDTGGNLSSGDSLEINIYQNIFNAKIETNKYYSVTVSGATDGTPSVVSIPIQAGTYIKTTTTGFTVNSMKVLPID